MNTAKSIDQAAEFEGVLADTISGRDYQTYLTAQGPAGWRESALQQIQAWLADRTIGVDVDVNRDVERTNEAGNVQVQVLHRRADGQRGTRVRVLNQNSGVVYTTKIMLVEQNRGGRGWMTVQTSCSDRSKISSVPNVVDRLLDIVDFEDGGPLLRNAQRVTRDGLRDLEHLLSDPNRRLPVVLAIPFDGHPFEPWQRQVAKWVRRSSGIAHVAVLDPMAAELFTQAHPQTVPPQGTLRTYPPGVDLTSEKAESACRWISPQTLVEDDKLVQRIIDSVLRRWQTERARGLPNEVRSWDSAFERIANQQMREASTPRRSQLAQQILDRRSASIALPSMDPEPIETISPDRLRDPEIPSPGETEKAEEPPQQDQPGRATSEGRPTAAILAARVRQLEEGSAILRDRLAAADRERTEALDLIAHVRQTTTLEDLRGEELNELVELAMREVADPAEVKRLNDRIDLLTLEREEGLEQASRLSDQIADVATHSEELQSDLGRQTRKSDWLISQLEEAKPGKAYEWVDDATLVRTNPLGEIPESWEALWERLPQLSDAGLVFTGQTRPMKPIDRLDTDGSALRATWDALGTLAAYRSARLNGWNEGVHAFCTNPPSSAFHVEPNKHSPDETSATRGDGRMAKERLLPVPVEVDKSKRVHMWSHFKIHTFSSERRVRLHYYDQVASTKQIYVGYIGDHLTSGSTTKVKR